MNFMSRSILFLSLIIFVSCSSDKEPSPDLCDGSFSLSEQTRSDANCGLSDGEISISASSTATPIIFRLNGNEQDNGNFSGLSAGSYTVFAIDGNDCTAELNFTIGNTNGVTASVNVQGTTCGTDAGSITINATNGVEPYSYRIDGGQAQANNTFSNLAQGSYTVVVTDDTGCEFESQVSVESDVVFAEVNNIVQTNCAISGCHNGSQNPNLSTPSQIASSATRIKFRTGQGSMPPAGSGRSLSQAEIDAIACWVDDGAQIN